MNKFKPTFEVIEHQGAQFHDIERTLSILKLKITDSTIMSKYHPLTISAPTGEGRATRWVMPVDEMQDLVNRLLGEAWTAAGGKVRHARPTTLAMEEPAPAPVKQFRKRRVKRVKHELDVNNLTDEQKRIINSVLC